MDFGGIRKCWALLAGAGAVEVVKQVVSPSPDATTLGLMIGPLLGVAGSLLPNIATDKLSGAESEQYAQRNHHLRLGMAAALRAALASLRTSHLKYSALFAHWDANLLAAKDRSILDILIPDFFEEGLFAAGSGVPDGEEAANALGSLLYNTLTTDLALTHSWTPAEAADLAKGLLPHYFAAFKQAAINDDRSHLFQAFTVNGINRLLALVSREHEATRAHMDVRFDRLEGRLEPRRQVVPRDLRPPALFLGREDQLRMMQRMLVRSDPASVFVFSVQGLPGVGKSVLCEQFAATHIDQFPGGYARITLDPEAGVMGLQLVQELAERFGVKGEAALLASLLRERLREPRSLVHVENTDSDGAGRAVAEMARMLGGCALMVSGRRAELGAGQGWKQVSVRPFGREEALAQLEAEIGRPPRDLKERADWELLLERCGYLPLAIHLCAGQLRSGLSVAEILPELLTMEPLDPADALYEQKARASLRSSFALSWRLFEGECRAGWANAFAAFSAAPLSGVGVGLGSAICGLDAVGFKRMMAQAVGLSLAIQDDAATLKWRLHALVREFLVDRPSAALEEGSNRQSAWFLERLPEREDMVGWDEIAVEEEALTGWLAGLDEEAAQHALVSGNWLARRRGPWRSWLIAAEQALRKHSSFEIWATSALVAAELAGRLGDPDVSLAYASVVRDRSISESEGWWAALASGQIADILTARGQLEEALRIRQEQQLPIYEKLGSIRNRAFTQGKIAEILLARGQLDEAFRILQDEESPVYEKLGDIRSLAVTQGKIAGILVTRGQLEEALRILQERQLPVYEKLGDIREQAVTHGQIADILMARGQLDEALRIREEQELPVYEKLGDIRERAITQSKVADIFMARGQLDEALRIREEQELPIFEKLGDIRECAVTQGKIADILMARGQLDEALRICQERQLPVFEKLSDILCLAITHSRIADILTTRGQLDEALRIREEQELPVFEKLGDIRERAITQGKIADIFMARGQLDEALRIREEQELPVYEKLGDMHSRAVTQGKVADIFMARGQVDRALRIRWEQQLPVYEKLGDIRSCAVTQGQIAMILAQKGNLHAADKLLGQNVIPVLEQLDDRRELVMIRANWAMVKRALKQEAEAVALLQLALDDAEALKLPVAAKMRSVLSWWNAASI